MQTKTKVFQIFLCIIILFSAVSMIAAQDVPPEVIEASKKGLPLFLNKIPNGALEKFGFDNAVSLDQVRTGSPFKLFQITPAALSSYRIGDTVHSVISKTQMWYFPIMIKDEIKAILVIDRMDDQWQAVSLGYAVIARELNKVIRKWPKSSGYNPLLISVFQAKEFLFNVPEINAYNLTSLTSIKTGVETLKSDADYSSLNKLSDVIERLKPVVEKNIRGN